MQGNGRLSGPTWPHQQNSATIETHASGMQRNHVSCARGQSEYRELDQLIARVIWESEHLRRYGYERRPLMGREHYECRRRRGAAQEPRPVQHGKGGRLASNERTLW